MAWQRGLAGLLLAAGSVLPAAAASPAPAATSQADAQAQMRAAEQARAAALEAQRAAKARAAAAATETARLTAARAETAAKLRKAEAATEAAAARMQSLAAARREAAAALDAQAAALGPMLPVIERLSLYPAETLLAVPAGPEETVRGVLVLQGLSRQIAEDAVVLRARHQQLNEAVAAEKAEAPHLAAAEAAQSKAAAELDRSIAQAEAGRHAALDQAQQEADRAAAMAARAAGLRSMIDALERARREAERRAAEEAARAARHRHNAEAEAARREQQALATPTGPGTIASGAHPTGQLMTPVVGHVVQHFGTPTAAGPATGVSFQAAPAARVVSPCSGRVEFAAPFHAYGLLVIVDCGGGYHAVLAGMESLDTGAGRVVHVGAPVGEMPRWNPADDSHPPHLYVELRHGGTAIDPLPWFAKSG